MSTAEKLVFLINLGAITIEQVAPKYKDEVMNLLKEGKK